MEESNWFLCARRAAALVALLSATACGPAEPQRSSEIRVSALPDQSPSAVRQQHGALIEWVCRSLDLRCRWVDSASYDDLVNRFGRREIDLAYFGGATFVDAHRQHGAIPLVMRDIDSRFTSAIYVRHADTAKSLHDLRATPFLFGPRRSTSGHAMPRHFLLEERIDAEKFFSSVGHSNGHDETLAKINSGQVRAGAVNASIARQIIRKNGHSLRVLWESPPYPDYVWAVQPGVPTALRLQIREAFLGLTYADAAARPLLDAQNARGYLPADVTDFKPLFSAFDRAQERGIQ